MTTAPPRRAGAREWGGLAVLALPTALLGLDVTVLYLALPELAADLGPTSTQELWIVDAYGFLIAGFLITMGTLGDRIGRRRLLMIGAAAFGAASVAAALATSPEMLILARAALGVAGATLMPSTLALISNMFGDARQRALAIGIWATMFAVGMAAGPLTGGVLLEYFWWGSAFLAALPVVGLTLLLAPVLLPEYRADQGGRFDLPSVVLSLAAMLPFVYGVKEFAKDGPTLSAVLPAVVGIAVAVVFVRRQQGLDAPLLDVALFRSRAFSAALVLLLVGLVGVGGAMFLVTQYLQLVAGMSPLMAGVWMGPPALAMFLAAIGAPLVARRVRPGYVAAVPLGLSAVGYAVLGFADAASGTVLVITGFTLAYLGLGALAALGTDLVVGAAPPQKAGSASAMSETVQELGIAVGVAVLGSVATAAYRSGFGAELPPGLPDHVEGAARENLSGAVSVAGELPDGVLDRARDAFTTGLNLVGVLAAVVIAALTVVAVVLLRHIGPIGAGAPDAADPSPGELVAADPHPGEPVRGDRGGSPDAPGEAAAGAGAAASVPAKPTLRG